VSAMARYHARVRALLDPTAAPPRGSAAIYRELVRAQHLHALATMFSAVRDRLGAPRFDALVDRFRIISPPRDPHPARWAEPFAAFLAARDDIDVITRATAELTALRIAIGIADDRPWTSRLRPHAKLVALPCDPRAPQRTGPTVLAIWRDDRGEVLVTSVGASEVAAWGIASGDADVARIAREGVDAESGSERLIELGLLRPA
jgi:hypothetical protein